MSVERNLIISVLKLTRKGPALIETINMDAHIPSIVTLQLLEKLQTQDLVYLNSDNTEVDSNNRLKLAVKAATLGSDVEKISNLLCWQEFEEIAAFALQSNGYSMHKNVRFKHDSKRWEIDVVGCKRPFVVCVDCKQWQRAISPSALDKIVELQVKRTEALADSLPTKSIRLECANWEKANFIPAVLSLVLCESKFCRKVPVVPILQLQDFIFQMPAHMESMKVIFKRFNKLSHEF